MSKPRTNTLPVAELPKTTVVSNEATHPTSAYSRVELHHEHGALVLIVAKRGGAYGQSSTPSMPLYVMRSRYAAGLENGDQSVVIADFLPVGTPIKRANV